MSERMTKERRRDLEQYFEREYLTAKELAEVKVEMDRARASEERLAEWARFIIRQGCSGNPRACASEPCPACRAKADLLAAGLEVES